MAVYRDIDFEHIAGEYIAQPAFAEFAGSHFHPRPGHNRNIEAAVAVGRRVVLVVDQERKGVFLAVFELGAVEGDQQFGSLLAGCERYRRRNGEQTRLVAGENRYGQRLVLGDAFYRDGDGGDVVADAMLGGHILGEVDLCAVDLGTCFEVIVAAGREQPRDDGDSRQKEYFYTFHK